MEYGYNGYTIKWNRRTYLYHVTKNGQTIAKLGTLEKCKAKINELNATR